MVAQSATTWTKFYHRAVTIRHHGKRLEQAAVQEAQVTWASWTSLHLLRVNVSTASTDDEQGGRASLDLIIVGAEMAWALESS